jgi:hypothetical protein
MRQAESLGNKGVNMGRNLGGPGAIGEMSPDDPIFSEGVTLTGVRRTRPVAALPADWAPSQRLLEDAMEAALVEACSKVGTKPKGSTTEP